MLRRRLRLLGPAEATRVSREYSLGKLRMLLELKRDGMFSQLFDPSRSQTAGFYARLGIPVVVVVVNTFGLFWPTRCSALAPRGSDTVWVRFH